MASNIIPFSELPLDKEGPFGNAWGRFGQKDQLGMLNLLTPEKKLEAAKEIKEGVSVSLDWHLDQPSYPFFNRQKFFHHVQHKPPRYLNDDIILMNTQCSSQWDGFRHFGYQEARKFYSGYTQEDIVSSDALGINVWLENGGIVSRGVLLDFASWAEKRGLKVDPFTRFAITADHLRQLVIDEKIETQPGDVLFIRSGWTAAYEALTPEEEATLPALKEGNFIGVESSVKTAEWLWENQFAAVAGDQPGFEQSPIWGSDTQLHQWLLAGWGCPIGEMFYLEDVARECKRLGRNTFFMTSMPLKVKGGVASPPNAVAIF